MTFVQWFLLQHEMLRRLQPVYGGGGGWAVSGGSRSGRRAWRMVLLVLGLALVAAVFASRIGAAESLPAFVDGTFKSSDDPNEVSATLNILGLLTVLSLAPAIFITTTSFIRIFIVFSFIKRALSVQEAPPVQLVSAFALLLTFMIMRSTFTEMKDKALIPYMEEEITMSEAYHRARLPLRRFMFDQTRDSDLGLFLELAEIDYEGGLTKAQIPTPVLVPSFIISELRRGFEMGFALYLPFLVIDMVVASTLISMGMMVLPPIFISLPFKVLLFVMMDGWAQLTRAVVLSFKPPPIN